MNKPRKVYENKKWLEFSKKVKRRDSYQCSICYRDSSEVTLQVHHDVYFPEKKVWEYAISDCRTLCKGCHAREHGLVEPDRGWTLITIYDLGDLDGTCERTGCGAAIRYEHLTYHPKWGYMVVGSTCIDHLTQKERLLSSRIIDIYKNISNFVHSSEWKSDFTKNGNRFIYSSYKHNIIRIYGTELDHSFQLLLKQKGARWYHYKKFVSAREKSTLETKELAYIALKGTLARNEEEKRLLRNLYRNLQS